MSKHVDYYGRERVRGRSARKKAFERDAARSRVARKRLRDRHDIAMHSVWIAAWKWAAWSLLDVPVRSPNRFGVGRARRRMRFEDMARHAWSIFAAERWLERRR